LARNGDPAAILQTAIDCAETHRLGAVTGYLEALIDSDLVTDDEKRKISAVQLDVATLRQSMSDESTQSENDEDAIEEKCMDLADALREIRSDRLAYQKETAQLYYSSIRLYRAGRLQEARQGFQRVLRDESLPQVFEDTVRSYLQSIDQAIGEASPPARPSP
jgi:hypothetical protein